MKLVDLARRLRPLIVKAAQSLPDEDALEAVDLYDEWAAGVAYESGYRVRYNGTLYTVLTAHTAQADWTPEAAPSLFAKVLIPDDDTVPAWEQPDSTNPYMTGDKVTHNGATWISTVDSNIWEPGVYGWDEV